MPARPADPAGALWPDGPVDLPARVRLDGYTYDVPGLPTRSLLYTLAADAWWQVWPNALPPAQLRQLMTRLYDEGDHLDMEHLWVVATDLLGRVAGTTPQAGGHGYAPAHRIALGLVNNWLVFDGWCVKRGFDPVAAPLRRVLAAGYTMLRENCTDQEEFDRLEAQVWAPPDHAPVAVPRHTPEQEALGALAALAAARPGETVARRRPVAGVAS